MLSNAYVLAKFRFDTAENEPAKTLQNFARKPRVRKNAAAREDPVQELALAAQVREVRRHRVRLGRFLRTPVNNFE